MALAIGVVAGDRIDIDKSQMIVKAILDDGSIMISVRGKDFRVSEEEAQEVLPNVFVSLGSRGSPDRRFRGETALPRLLFEAPREIRIRRRAA